jgi:hypothetical protein
MSSAIPRFYRSVRPAVGGGGQLAGLADRYAAGVGRAVAGLGGQVAAYAERKADEKLARADALAASRAWRGLDEFRLQYLRSLGGRRKELAQVEVDPATGEGRTGYERELEAYPGALQEEFERLAGGLSSRARAHLETRYNEVAANWADEAVRTLDGMELQDATAEILATAQAGRAGEAGELLEAYADRFEPQTRQALEAKILQAGMEATLGAARADLQAIAAADGWQAAVAQLADPEYQKLWGLDIEEAAGAKRDLEAFARDEAALAEQKQRIELEKTADEVLARALEGTLDLAMLPALVRDNRLDAAVAREARALMVKPPLENDFETFLEAEAKLSLVRQKQLPKGEALAWLRTVASRLETGTREQYVTAYEKAGDWAEIVGAPSVALFEKAIDDHYETLETFGKWGTREAEAKYLDTKLRFRAWLGANPGATDEQVRAKYEELLAPTAKPAITERIRKLLWASSIYGIGQWWWQGVRQQWAGLAGGADPAAAFVPVNPGAEPRTRQEFEDTVKGLNDSPAEQEAYYNQWVGKWR